MSNPTNPGPQQPQPGTILDVMWHAGAEMARVTLYLRSQGAAAQGQYPDRKTMERIRAMLIEHNVEVPANLNQALDS